jgi:ubiquitin C-terminal hydrolase
MFKDNRLVECLPNTNHILNIPITIDDTVSFSNKFSLVATINHSGNLVAGHYWAFIKEKNSNSWLQCNDKSVLKVKPSALNNNSFYVLFYVGM